MTNIRQLAESDLSFVLEDGDNGFGWPVTITSPDGTEVSSVPDPSSEAGERPLYCASDDITQIIDPDTGQIVTGRLASAVLRISTLRAAGLTIPQGIADTAARPWLVRFADINGVEMTFKVSQSNPDRALGVVVLLLETYLQ